MAPSKSGEHPIKRDRLCLVVTSTDAQIAVPRDSMTTFDYHEHKRHVLFCGTELMQGRCEGNNVYMKAVVIRTGKLHQTFHPLPPSLSLSPSFDMQMRMQNW